MSKSKPFTERLAKAIRAGVADREMTVVDKKTVKGKERFTIHHRLLNEKGIARMLSGSKQGAKRFVPKRRILLGYAIDDNVTEYPVIFVDAIAKNVLVAGSESLEVTLDNYKSLLNNTNDDEDLQKYFNDYIKRAVTAARKKEEAAPIPLVEGDNYAEHVARVVGFYKMYRRSDQKNKLVYSTKTASSSSRKSGPGELLAKHLQRVIGDSKNLYVSITGIAKGHNTTVKDRGSRVVGFEGNPKAKEFRIRSSKKKDVTEFVKQVHLIPDDLKEDNWDEMADNTAAGFDEWAGGKTEKKKGTSKRGRSKSPRKSPTTKRKSKRSQSPKTTNSTALGQGKRGRGFGKIAAFQ